MAVFVSYSDESETGNRSDFLVSGYVAAETLWEFVAKAWQERVLDGKPPIPYLHMNEIRDDEWRATKGKGISRPEAENRIDEAVTILSATGVLYIASSVIKRSDLESAIHSRFTRKKDITEALAHPDYFCFHAYCNWVLGIVRHRVPEVEKVNFVLSNKKKITHHLVIDFQDEIRNLVEPELRGLMGSIIPGDMELYLPLQAADVICWYQQRDRALKLDGVDKRHFAKLRTTWGHTHNWELAKLEGIAARLNLIEAPGHSVHPE